MEFKEMDDSAVWKMMKSKLILVMLIVSICAGCLSVGSTDPIYYNDRCLIVVGCYANGYMSVTFNKCVEKIKQADPYVGCATELQKVSQCKYMWSTHPNNSSTYIFCYDCGPR